MNARTVEWQLAAVKKVKDTLKIHRRINLLIEQQRKIRFVIFCLTWIQFAFSSSLLPRRWFLLKNLHLPQRDQARKRVKLDLNRWSDHYVAPSMPHEASDLHRELLLWSYLSVILAVQHLRSASFRFWEALRNLKCTLIPENLSSISRAWFKIHLFLILVDIRLPS